MFWKNVKSFQLRPLSLVAKLAWFYSLSTISLLVALYLFLYPTLIKMMVQINSSQATTITAECHNKFIIALLLSSLSAIIFAYVIALKGLNKIKEFENKIAMITADSLHERI